MLNGIRVYLYAFVYVAYTLLATSKLILDVKTLVPEEPDVNKLLLRSINRTQRCLKAKIKKKRL